MTTSAYIGSSLDDLLEETADLAEVGIIAIERVVAWQVADAMRQQDIGKAAMARRMNLSRAQVGRLLEPVGDVADPRSCRARRWTTPTSGTGAGTPQRRRTAVRRNRQRHP